MCKSKHYKFNVNAPVYGPFSMPLVILHGIYGCTIVCDLEGMKVHYADKQHMQPAIHYLDA